MPRLKNPLRKISELTATLPPPSPHDPPDRGAEMASINPRPLVRDQWPMTDFRWKASALVHRPLYFEDIGAERYGHTLSPCLQPLASATRFYASVFILPYKMGLQTPNECVYTLGYYRPGSCAPYMIDPLPFTWRAAAFQAGAVTGTAFVIP